jgi:tetraacyldisaccharide 4'-kinase
MNRAASVALSPLGGLYGLAMKARRAFYRRGLFRTQDVGVPVISVGNVTLGGTGKTPLVEWIANRLANANRRVCILTRGYGRANAHRRVIVSNGVEILSDAARAGDEAFLLAEKLKGQATVISDADRASAAHWAIENLGSDVFVLDDGFQNLGLARSLDIVTLDATNPWGNRRLFPSGTLREHPGGIARADCVVLTRVDLSDQLEELEREIRELSHGRPVFRSHMKIESLRPVNSVSGKDSPFSLDEIKSSTAAAFCGIGNPESFFDQLRSEGYELAHTRVFRDHYAYAQADIDRIVRESNAAGVRTLLTTAKDEVKLRELSIELPCYAVDITIEVEEEDQFQSLIESSIQKK